MDFISHRITVDDTDRRLDRVIRKFMPDVPLSGIYRFLRTGLIRVNGKKAKPADKLEADAVIEIACTLVSSGKKQIRGSATAVNTMPDILLETPDLLFINKPCGISVHGPGGLDRLVPPSDSESKSLSFRCGPLHRLDKDTSGIIAISRTLRGARWFTEALRVHRIGKYYLGIAEGLLDSNGSWHDTDESGKDMITRIMPIATGHRANGTVVSLLQYQIQTGRKHQIRRQTSLHGHPLSGDVQYGGNKQQKGYYLHAWQLHLPEDRPEQLPECIVAPLPEAMRSEIRMIFGENVLAKLDTLTVY